MMDENKKAADEKESEKPVEETEALQSLSRLSTESWKAKAADSGLQKLDSGPKQIESPKIFAAKKDAQLLAHLEKWSELGKKSPSGEPSALRKFESFLVHINGIIKDKNSTEKNNTPEINKDRFAHVLSTVEKYQSNKDALLEAGKTNNQQEIQRLLKEQEELVRQIESRDFREDLEKASFELSRAFNVLHKELRTTYDGMLNTLVDYGRQIPLEQLPQDLPVGLKGFPISNEQFKSLVSQKQLQLPERVLSDYEIPSDRDLKEINKILRFTDAATQEINRGMLEQQYHLAQSRLNQIDASGELAKKWFPENVESLSNLDIEKRIAAATPWIQKGKEVQRYAELHHRFHKMVNEQFTWPSWLGGIPTNWDASAIEKHKDIVSVTRDDKTGRVSISVKMPDSLDRNDGTSEQMRQLDEWLAKYKGPVDQALSQIDGAKGENNVIYWGDIKSEMRVDRDGNIVEKGFQDAVGRQVFQESDGRKYRFSEGGTKEWVPLDEKLSEREYRVINGKTDWVKPGEKIEDINLMEFRTEAKAVKGEKGEDLIEIKQVQKLQYAHWASYQGWGWVSDIKTMGGDIKAQKIDADMSIAEDQGAAGGRRQGKAGDYLVTLEDGRKQFVDAASFEKLYRPKEGKAGEYEEKPKQYKPDDWLVVFRTDSGIPQPTLMQAKDVPDFCSSQKKWHYGTKAVVAAVDAALLVSGVAEVRAAMVGVEAAAGTAAKMTTAKVLGKALLTHQGAFGAFHAGLGATGFMGQGIENLGPYGKTFMHVRAMAMIADLGYTAIGRPFSPAPFVPSAEQLAGQGFFTRGLLNFNHAYNETALTSLLGIRQAANYLGRFEALQKIASYLSPISAATRIPGVNAVGNFLANASAGRMQALGADVFFLSDIGIRQIPGIINRSNGTDSQQVQQQQALERRWVQSSLPEDRKTPSSFDKQSMLRIEAFREKTDEALKLPENDPKRQALNKQLIETIKNESADSRDRLGAALALVTLNGSEAKLADKISAGDTSISKEDLQKFIDSRRYVQAKEVISGYEQGLKVHVSPETQNKLAKINEQARLSFSDNGAERENAMASLLSTFNSANASPEEKLLAASSILFARRRAEDGRLSDTISAGGHGTKALELVDFLHKHSQAKQGDSANPSVNPGHMRLFSGDMLLRLDIDRFSIADMSQICLSIVNDKNAPLDPEAKERWTQLKLQAMVDVHGLRLGDLFEMMQSRIEPEIAALPALDQSEQERKGLALASLHGRDSQAIKKALEELRSANDPRLQALSSYMLYANDNPRASERVDALAKLHDTGNNPLALPEVFSKEKQLQFAENLKAEVLSKLKAELPGQAGEEYDRVSWNKLRAAKELIAQNPDLKTKPELQAELNSALISLISADNPELASKALSTLMPRLKSYEAVFRQADDSQLSPELKALKEKLFAAGSILETLRDNSLDMLQDSSAYSSYTTRADNLARDLATLQAEYEKNKDKVSESARAEIEARIKELSHIYSQAQSAPQELKKALLAALPEILTLSSSGEKERKTFANAALSLAEINTDKPETASPELRARAIKAASELAGSDKLAAQAVFSRSLKDDPSPLVRMASLKALQKLAPENLQEICLQQLGRETHPQIAKALREIEFVNRRPDPDSREFQEKFNKARLDLINSAARSLSGAEDFLKSNADLKSLDGYTLRAQAYAELKDLYFNGVGGFFRFVWEGEKGVDADHAKLLDKYAGRMRDSMESLAKRAATDDEALKALVYIGLSNGRPLLKDDRNWGAEKATEKLKELCRDSSPERAKQLAWAVEMLLLHQPKMSASGRQNVLEGLKYIMAKPGQAGISDGDISTLVSTALQRELKNTPEAGAKDFAAREKLQLDMLKILEDPRFARKDILPTLEALAEGTAKFKVSKDATGDVSKVQYADGSSRELQKRNGEPYKYIFRDASGKETVWLKDGGKPKTWYKESDTQKKEPWSGESYFDNATGDYVRINDKDKVKSVFKASGGQIDSVDGKVSKITYPDGSSRQFEPPGDKYERFIFTHKDGKPREIWQRDGQSNKFFKADDRQKIWTGDEHIDTASGDYLTVQGSVRTIHKVNGQSLQIKDGRLTELAPPSSIAFNTSIASVRNKAQEMLARLSDRSEIIRQETSLPEGANADSVASKISRELGNTRASSEKVGRAIALSEKLGAVKHDEDPRRAPLQIAARDGHELVRLMAARELARSSNADDRKLAYAVLAKLEAQGSRKGYVDEAHELLDRLAGDSTLDPADKAGIETARKEAGKLDTASYRSQERLQDLAAGLDYQDSYERATRELKETALRKHNLAKYEGSDNWFSKSENFSLLDADKIRAAQKQAVHDAYPGPLRWLFMSKASIDKVCDDAVKEVWNRQERQLAALGEQAKLAGDAGKEAREALASIILTQGQPLRESDRNWAMHEAARMIRDCVKDGHPGSRDMLWVVQAALIEEPALDQTTRFYLMNTLEHAKQRGIVDSKEASIIMAAALESEYLGMPSQSKAPQAYKDSIENQKYAITLLSLWANPEATPTLQALANHHPDAGVRGRAKDALILLNLRQMPTPARDGTPRTNLQRRSEAGSSGDKSASLSGDRNLHLAINQLEGEILDLERVRLGLPKGTSPEQIRKAIERENG